MSDTQIAQVDPIDRDIEIVPFGSDEVIRLNVKMVQKMIAVRTKQGHIPDTVQCMKFLMLCKARHLNPWEGDAFLIGYDGKDGPQFSLITAHQVFLKRAEASKEFDGMESGVIVEGGGVGDVIEREGDLVYDGEKLIGGWAKVFRKDRGRPIYKRLKLATFNTNRSRWLSDAPGMIVKCTEADALRTSFPTHLGGLYMKEELEPIDITPKAAMEEIQFGEAVPEQVAEGGRSDIPPKKRTRKPKQEALPEPAVEPEVTVTTVQPNEQVQEQLSEPEPEFSAEPLDPLIELRKKLLNAEITEQQFKRYLIIERHIEPNDRFEKMPEQRLLDMVNSFDSMLDEVRASIIHP